ncbi:helix-turn-helix domain-containing protein [Paenibacillus melissococcoides]|uniref:Helix-turn-helix domain-containing protein n=1 Tax=Paenibacillus melissococcoides TaxID=2912268 RepID=A0ABM9G9S5_9BACL|nr:MULTISPECIES: S24 family peptidase [Paenibacillus]MEB9897519.1 S24 family peptidase [Bacillus cereus]CAH8248771.1 helix-turn-helix domain-containing protein [Paenibacillus melissococcoides]CAH8713778.1 helix-turn-helix domain-containing protein [Paenibacillus melissococcoides]CAH8720454.1 helix-turn-helix domain-containing protein [Paenibacillus melissococcoides]GIO82713.1 hypothetical protein J6TS7_63230 [Paenibacillus dendritiformis]
MLETIGQRIRHLRKQAGISMDSLAGGIGSNSGTITYWENDKRLPGAEYIIALAKFFNVTTDWILIGGNGQTPKSEQIEPALFFDEKREVVSHFDSLIDSLGEQDRAFIDRFIKLALLEKRQEGGEVQATRNESAAVPNLEKSKELPVVKEVAASHKSPSAIPILGRAAAGVPIELVRFIEGYLRVSEKYRNCFAVRVDGESMINAGIENGGYVVVRQQSCVDNNDIALVKVDDGVTIKRFKMHNDLAYLISENDGMQDMVYDPKVKDMQILGLVVDIIRPEEAPNLVVEEL